MSCATRRSPRKTLVSTVVAYVLLTGDLWIYEAALAKWSVQQKPRWENGNNNCCGCDKGTAGSLAVVLLYNEDGECILQPSKESSVDRRIVTVHIFLDEECISRF
jgi:hypothetical protein